MLKNLYKAVFTITVFSILTRVMGFFTRIFISRELGAEAMGVYQISSSILAVFLTIVNSGIPLTISRLSAEYRAKNKIDDESRAVSAGTIISTVIAIILSALTIILKDFLVKLAGNYLIIAILIALLPTVIATALNVGFKGALWGRQKHFENSLVDFIESIIKVLLCFILIKNSASTEQGIINCAISISTACVIATIISMLLYFKSGGKLKNPKGKYRLILSKSTPITLLRIVSSIASSLMSIIIPARLISAGYSSEQAISLFGIALGMTLPLLYLPNTLVGSLSTALVPDLAKLKAEENSKEFILKVKSSLTFSVFISVFFIPSFMGIGTEIGSYVYNSSFSGTLLKNSAFLMLPMGLNSITSSILNSMGLEVKTLIHYAIGAVGLFLSIWFLPEFFGIYAVCIGMGFSLIVSTLLNLRLIKKELNAKDLILKDTLKMCLFLIPSVLINNFTYNLFIQIFTQFFAIAFSCIIGAIFFVTLCLIFKVFTLDSLFVNFKKIRVLKRKKATKNV